MIINATRIRTASGAGAVGMHVFAGPKNEIITALQGEQSELFDMMRDAASYGAKYGIRHFSISPEQAMTREDAMRIVHNLAEEFGFDSARAVVVEHQKRRANDSGFERHWHALAPEVDPVKGRVLDDKWMRARHEKIARQAEIRLGHESVAGRFNTAVERALRAEGHYLAADKMATLTARERPKSAFSPDAHQAAQRLGRSLPDDRALVKRLWKKSDNGKSFVSAASEAGLSIRQGDKENVYIVEREGQFIGALDRLAGEKRDAVSARMAVVIEPTASLDNLPSARLENSHSQISTGETQKIGVAPVVHTPAQPVAKAAGISSGNLAGLSSGSGMASSHSMDSEFIEPIDPSKPDDAARFLRQWAAAEARRVAAASGSAGPARQTGVIHDGHQYQRSVYTTWAEAYGPTRARASLAAIRAQAVVDVRPQGDRQRDSRPNAGAGSRPEGPDASDLRRHGGGSDSGRPDAVARTVGTDRTALENRPGAGSVGENRRQSDPHRAAAECIRIAGWRAVRDIEKAITPDRQARLAVLAQTLTPLRDRALQRLVHNEHALRNERGPWPELDSRGDGHEKQRAAEEAFRCAHQRQARHIVAVRNALPVSARLFAWLGLPSPAVRKLNEQIDRFNSAHKTLDRDASRAGGREREATWRRRDEHVSWKDNRDHNLHGNQLVRRAIDQGDKHVIKAVADGDIERIRVKLLREEQQLLREKHKQLQRDRKRKAEFERLGRVAELDAAEKFEARTGMSLPSLRIA